MCTAPKAPGLCRHHLFPQTLDGEIEDNIQAMISLDQQERMKELANEMAMA